MLWRLNTSQKDFDMQPIVQRLYIDLQQNLAPHTLRFNFRWRIYTFALRELLGKSVTRSLARKSLSHIYPQHAWRSHELEFDTHSTLSPHSSLVSKNLTQR